VGEIRDGLRVGGRKGLRSWETRSLERGYGHCARRKRGGGNWPLAHLDSVARHPMQDRCLCCSGIKKKEKGS